MVAICWRVICPDCGDVVIGKGKNPERVAINHEAATGHRFCELRGTPA